MQDELLGLKVSFDLCVVENGQQLGVKIPDITNIFFVPRVFFNTVVNDPLGQTCRRTALGTTPAYYLFPKIKRQKSLSLEFSEPMIPVQGLGQGNCSGNNITPQLIAQPLSVVQLSHNHGDIEPELWVNTVGSCPFMEGKRLYTAYLRYHGSWEKHGNVNGANFAVGFEGACSSRKTVFIVESMIGSHGKFNFWQLKQHAMKRYSRP